MNKITLTFICCIFSLFLTQAQENNFGILFNVESTTLTVDTGETVINYDGTSGQRTENLGRKVNFSAGVYGTINLQDNTNIAIELFYNRTSAKDVPNATFDALNLVPYIDIDYFDINLYFNVGAGMGYMINKPDFNDESITTEDFDFFGKFALAYKFDDLGRIEAGFNLPFTEVINDNISRSKYYIGVKFPIFK